MIVKAITIPTPRKIKKRINKYITGDRIVIYTLIGTGIGVILLNSVPIKAISIGALLYCGAAYEVIDREIIEIEDQETINKILDMNFYNMYNRFY